MPKKILLTNGRSPAALDLLRSFENHGHEVYIAESLPLHLCQFSRFGHSLRVPAPRQHPREYINCLIEIVNKYSIDLIFPIYEEVFTIGRFRHEFDGLCEVLCSDFSLLKRLHSKYNFMEMCREYGLSHPQSELLHAAEQTDDYSNKVLKPLYSRFGTDVYIKPDSATVHKLSFTKPWVMQQFVEGTTYCVYCLAHEGRILALSIYPMEVTLMGACISFRHEDNPQIMKWVSTFIEKSGVSGSISFDMIIEGSIVYPLECNPRVTSGIHLLSQSEGFNEAVLEKKPLEQAAYKPTMLAGFVFSKALLRWSYWKIFWRSKDVLFRWSEPFILPGQFICVLYFQFLALKYRTSVNEASTLDIEWNGEQL